MDSNVLKALHDARTRAAEELRDLYSEAAGRELEAEERSREDALAQSISDHDARIATALKQAEAEKRAAEAFEAFPTEERAEVEEPAGPSDADILRGIAQGEIRSHEFGPEEQRDNLKTGSAGNTVPTSFYNSLVEYMIETSTVLAAGATVVRTAGGEDLQIPVATAFPTASLVAENGAIGESDPTFAQKTLGAYKYGFITQASSELLDDTAINLPEFLARRGGEALGNGIGTAFVSGTGSSQPQGIIAASGGLNTVASATGSVAAGFDYEDLVSAVHGVDRPYRAGSVWILNDAVLAELRKLVDGQSRPLWQAGLTAGAPDTLLGYPVYVDPAMPTATTNGTKGIVFGNIGQAVMVRFAGGVRVDSSTEYGYANDLVSWRFLVRADSEVVNPNAAKALTYTT